MAQPEAPTTRLTPRQAQRRERILKVTQQLTGEHGYDGASMRAIARASHVAEKTLYNIFGSKDRLIAMAAQQRSADTFEAATREAPQGGVAFLLAFGRAVAEVTLDDPAMARVLSQVLLDHSDLVGLNDLYDHYIGVAYDQMIRDGAVDERTSRAGFTRLYRLSTVSIVVLWAKGEIADAALAAHLELEVYRNLLPIARPAFAKQALRRSGEIARTL